MPEAHLWVIYFPQICFRGLVIISQVCGYKMPQTGVASTLDMDFPGLWKLDVRDDGRGRLVPGEAQVPVRLCPHTVETDLGSLPLLKRTHLMTSTNPNHLPKPPPPNTPHWGSGLPPRNFGDIQACRPKFSTDLGFPVAAR